MSGFKDLPRPKEGTPNAAPSGDGAPGAGEHPLLDHVPPQLRSTIAERLAAGKPYDEMSDEERQAEAKRLIRAEDATLAKGEQMGLE